MGQGFCVIERMPVANDGLHDFRHVTANPAFAQVTGVADVLGQTVRAVFPDESQAQIDIYCAVLETGRSRRFEPRFSTGGSALEAYAFRVEDGTHSRVGVIVSDVSVRKRAETARGRNQARLVELNASLEHQIAERALERGLFWQSTTELLCVLNTDGLIEKSNPAWQTVLGWTPQEIRAMSIFDLIHPDDLEMAHGRFHRLVRGEPARSAINRYRGQDGTYRWMSWSSVVENGKFYCSAHDITKEKEAQVALTLSQEALRQSQKMEAASHLAGGIAHDFNNLLGSIGASLQVLEMRLNKGQIDGADRYITMGQDSVRRAALLTQRLLAFSRHQTRDPKLVELNRLIGSMGNLIRRTVGPGVELEMTLAAGLWPTRIDSSRLQSALLTLCINARDAMRPEGGRMIIETANAWLGDRAAKEHGLAQGQYITLSVTDTGMGMPAEMANRVFDPFYTTRPLGQGTGPGLSMVYGFVLQSGGQVRISSKLGHGTTLCIYLPKYVADVEQEQPDGLPEPHEAGEGKTVLIVEDETTIRLLIAEVLEEAGYRVLGAGDGPTGLRVLQADGRVDLLVTDVGLPGGMSGRQVADAGRLKRPGLKVLFITGYAEHAVIGNGKPDGQLERGMEVLTKPFEITLLAKKVREMIEH
jgi:PAS domain S-box-containing protein